MRSSGLLDSNRIRIVSGISGGDTACCTAFSRLFEDSIATPTVDPKATSHELISLLSLSLHDDVGAAPPPPPLLVFGGPGVGKSYFVCRLEAALRPLLGETAVALVADYGIVAEHIGGHTIYAWAGLRVGDEQLDVVVIVDRITNHQPAALRRWRSVLVVC